MPPGKPHVYDRHHTIKKTFKAEGEGQQLSLDGVFSSTSVFFIEPNSSSFESTGFVDQGVTYYNLINVYNDCVTYPQNDLRYLGVKLDTPEGPKLGWLWLGLSGNYTITVYGWGIQP